MSSFTWELIKHMHILHMDISCVYPIGIFINLPSICIVIVTGSLMVMLFLEYPSICIVLWLVAEWSCYFWNTLQSALLWLVADVYVTFGHPSICIVMTVAERFSFIFQIGLRRSSKPQKSSSSEISRWEKEKVLLIVYTYIFLQYF